MQKPSRGSPHGWYPQSDGTERFWDGNAWTQNIRTPFEYAQTPVDQYGHARGGVTSPPHQHSTTTSRSSAGTQHSSAPQAQPRDNQFARFSHTARHTETSPARGTNFFLKLRKPGLMIVIAVVVLLRIFSNIGGPSSGPTNDSSSSVTSQTAGEVVDDAEHAAETAERFLEFSSYSHVELLEALEEEGYSTDAAKAGIEEVSPDWNTQALNRAHTALAFWPHSEQGLKEMLEFVGYTDSQVDYAMERIDVDWKANAVEHAEVFADDSDLSLEEIEGMLEYEGFTPEEIRYGMANADL